MKTCYGKGMLLMSICLTPFILCAQNIQGTLRDNSNKPIVSATISLLKAADSTVVKTFVTTEDGNFQFTKVQPATYRIGITAIGFEPYTSDTFQVTTGGITLPAIRLSPAAANSLGAVTVTARKPFIERKIDRTVVNVDALISNAGTNALEVLDKSPGIIVDQDGNISMNGKPGVVIFIDDKPTYLSGADLASYLKSLPSGTLESIEIMTTPPARYDAAGNAGIINIKTKKLKQKGFNGNIAPSYMQGIYPKTNNSFNFNLRNNAFNYYLNAGLNYSKGFNDLLIERQYYNEDGSPHSLFSQKSWIVRKEKAGSIRAGVDYAVNKNTSIGLVLNGVGRNTAGLVDNKSRLYNGTKQLDSLITADNTDNRTFRRGSVGLTLRNKHPKNGRELGVDLDYIYNQSGADQLFKNASYLADNTLKTRDDLSGNLPSYINIYGAKADYTYPLSNGAIAEAGVKSNFIKTNNRALYYVTIDNVTNPDYEKTNHFKYEENINAGYLNFSKDNKRFSWQAGLRVENTIMKGHQLGNQVKPDSAFERDYTNLFPTVYLSWKLDSAAKNQLTLSYSKRIQRPNFGNLNPFISPLDKFTYYVGNPYLQPTISHNIELSHIYNNKITTTLAYEYYDGDINETIELQGHQYYSRPANTGKSQFLWMSVNATFEPAAWCTINWSVFASYSSFKLTIATMKIDTSGINYSTNFNSQFRLGKGWTAELLGMYRSDWVANQFVLGDYWSLSGAVQKKILKGKGSLKVSVQDIFYTRLNYGDINNLQNAKGWYRNKGDFRVGALTFTYNFGKTFETRRRMNGSADAEQQRI